MPTLSIITPVPLSAKKKDSFISKIINITYSSSPPTIRGTERLNRYEEYFADKGVEIVYSPYTQASVAPNFAKLSVLSPKQQRRINKSP